MPITVFEEYHTAEWIKQRISADTTLEAYLDLIPDDVGLPAVRMSVQSRNDVRGIGDERERIMTELDWLVVVVREGLLVAPILSHVIALDNALHNKSGTTAQIQVLSCVRLEPFSLLEPGDSGVHYRHAGGIYRTIVQTL